TPSSCTGRRTSSRCYRAVTTLSQVLGPLRGGFYIEPPRSFFVTNTNRLLTLAALVVGVSGTAAAQLTGAGATFPYPIYNKWFTDYAAKTKVEINYQSIGSGGGVKQISEQTVDFGATDGPMSDEELGKAKGGAILHFPTVLGADVIIYNVPGLTKPLKLSGATIADIFLGK